MVSYIYNIYIFIYRIIVYPLKVEAFENCFAGWTPMATWSKPQVPLYLDATAGLRELHDRDRDEAGGESREPHPIHPEPFGNLRSLMVCEDV